jgi:pSer/pThr/pTyr-binding forkhead associated (FHA) protein
MAKAVLTFALYQGDTLTRRETVTQDIVKVGKDPKSHLRVDDEQASRMHAVIEVAGPEDITLIDLGNEPGTMVNGARVNKCKLHVGDQIQVGQTYLVRRVLKPLPHHRLRPRTVAPPRPIRSLPAPPARLPRRATRSRCAPRIRSLPVRPQPRAHRRCTLPTMPRPAPIRTR